MTDNSVAIRKMNTEYLVSNQHPEPFAIRDRLDRVLRRDVASSLASVLRHGMPPSDDSLMFVRSLSIDISVNADWDDGMLAAAWADSIARGLARVIGDRQRDDEIAWFASWADYLADFLRQASTGTAWNRWYFSRFKGLRMLPTSAAMRTALTRDACEGLAALHAMPAPDVAGTLSAMTRGDARRVTDALFAAGPAHSDSLARALVHTWSAGTFSAATSDEEPGCTLLLCIELARGYVRFVGHALAESARGLIRLARLMDRISAGETMPLREAVARGDLAALYAAAGTADGEVIAPLCQWPHDLRVSVTQRVSEKVDPSAARSSTDWETVSPVRSRDTGSQKSHGGMRERVSEDDPSHLWDLANPGDAQETSFGGLFLLLPILDEILKPEAVSNWPDPEGCSAISALRTLILSRCFGRERSLRVLGDPLVCAFAGAPGLVTRDIYDWLSEVTRTRWRTLTEDISARIRPVSLPSASSVLIGSVPSRGGRTAIAIESHRGCWLFAAGYQAARPMRLIERVLQQAHRVDATGLVIQDAALLEGFQSADFDIPVFWNEDPGISETLDGSQTGLREQRARLGRLASEFAYLGDHSPYRMATHADLALRVAAQNVLRLFASRLPGFAHSSLTHLHHNFLATRASVENEVSGRIVVRLTRPPLHLILNMTGMSRAAYRLSWMEERLFALFPEA